MTVTEESLTDLARVEEIVCPRMLYASVIAHAVRKFTDHYLDGETPEHKAFGMLAGHQTGTCMRISGVFPLLVNLRHDLSYQADMNSVVEAHAIASQTPMERRGWIADGRELMAIEEISNETGAVVFGNYHTHRVAWPHDQLRDTCTELDRVLAGDSGQWTFILSVVDLHCPRLRAFYEGDNAREAPIRIVSGAI
jgi:hypothetical protein